FIDAVTPSVIDNFEKLIAKHPSDTAIVRSGISSLIKIGQQYDADARGVSDLLFQAISSRMEDPRYGKAKILGGKGFDKRLDVVLHELPLGPLSLLANGFASGKEEAVARMIKPHLEASLRIMNKA